MTRAPGGCEGGFALALAGGGTGGHIVPGLHLLRHFAAAGHADGDAVPLDDLLWFVSGRDVEERVLAGVDEIVAGAGVERVALHLEPPRGGAPSLFRTAWRLLPETLVARRALQRHGSRLLFGLGGFTSLPAVLAARSLGIPVALLEINAARGRATRWLAPFARRVYHAWPGTVPAGGGARHVHLGPPLAPVFSEPPPDANAQAQARGELGFEAARPLLLILGGSQGALALNAFAREHAGRLVEAGVQVLHQTGPGRREEGSEEFAGYRAVEYVDDMPLTLAAATLVLGRGGASSLAEIAVRAVPAVVVPYPHHADRHQERNARSLGEGTIVVHEAELGAGTVALLVELASDAGEERRRAMSSALRDAVPADAGARLREQLLSLAGLDSSKSR